MKMALLLLLLWSAALSSQAVNNDAALARIHKRLLDSQKFVYPTPIMFIGEINWMGPAYHGVCKEAVSREVEFTISQVLLGNYQDSQMRTGYVDCGELSSPPFTLHIKLIVYCEQRVHSTFCFMPVEFTDERLKKVKSWIAALHHHAALQHDGNEAALPAVHERLQDSHRLAQQSGLRVYRRCLLHRGGSGWIYRN
jgi:hypothetical protein